MSRARARPVSGFDVYAIVDPRQEGALACTRGLIALGGRRLGVQIRAKGAGPEVHAAALEALAPDAARCGTALLISTHVELAARAGVGVHLPEDGPEVSEVRRLVPNLIGVSCHDGAGLVRRAGADFAVLGPVAEVPGKSTPLGWSAFQELAKAAPMPVYALGGIASADDVIAARTHGARGVAALRALTGPDAEATLTRWLAASGTMRP